MNTLVIFDLDGTLVESEKAYAQANHEVYADYGYNYTEEAHYTRWTGMSTRKKLEIIEAETGVHIDYDEIYPRMHARWRELLEKHLDAAPHVSQMLENLNLPHCIVSASPLDLIQKSIQGAHIAEHFTSESLFSSDMVKNGKPAPDVFLFAAEKMGFTPQECVVIEDGIMGIQGAKAAGMRTFGYVGGVHRTSDFAPEMLKAGADLVFEDMRELKQLILQTQT